MVEDKQRSDRPRSKLADKLAKRKAKMESRLSSMGAKLKITEEEAAAVAKNKERNSRKNRNNELDLSKDQNRTSGPNLENRNFKQPDVGSTSTSVEINRKNKGASTELIEEDVTKNKIEGERTASEREGQLHSARDAVKSNPVSLEKDASLVVENKMGIDSASKSDRPESKPKASAPTSKKTLTRKPLNSPSPAIGLGAKTESPSSIIKKVLRQLEVYSDISLAEHYSRKFVTLLRELNRPNITIALYFEKVPNWATELIDISGDTGFTKESNGIKEIPVLDLKTLGFSNVCNAIYAFELNKISELPVSHIAEYRKKVDIHIIVSCEADVGAVMPLLERVSHGSYSSIVVAPDAHEDVEASISVYESALGYEVGSNRAVTLNADLNLIESPDWIRDVLLDQASREVIKDFSLHRQITLLVSEFDSECQTELRRIANSFDKDSVSDGYQGLEFSKLDAIVKNLQESVKLQLNSKGLTVDDFGEISFVSTLNEHEVAQGLVSEMTMNDLVREDELNMQVFNAEENKLIKRIKRFRFASKLGFLWKLKPEYIDRLHMSTQLVISRHINDLHRQISAVVQTQFRRMSEITSPLAGHSNEARRFEQFRSASWSDSSKLMAIINERNDLNHFRSGVYSKRGGAAPIEKEGGMLKELRESRMFVSQLMAFGMLGAIVLGSTFAIDVLVGWFTGGGGDFGSELQEAAQNSRGLGRQVRIMIMGVAGISIMFYLALRLYLKKSEQIIERSRFVAAYSTQLEDSVASFILESSNLAKEILAADIQRLITNYGVFRSEFCDDDDGGGFGLMRASIGGKSTTPQMSGTNKSYAKQVEDLAKWSAVMLNEREVLSIIQNQNKANAELTKVVS